MNDYLDIGRVANAHGVKGFLKVLPTTYDIKRFELLETVLLEDPTGRKQTYKIEQIKYLNQFVLLKIEGIDDMDAALTLKRSVLSVHRKEALPLEADENYICDLIGLIAVTTEGEVLGPVIDVLVTGAHDVYVIDNKSKHGLMLPAIKQWVHEVNLEEKTITVTIPEGLSDL